MTLPNERFNAIKSTRDFLYDLIDPKKTPRIPLVIRRRARNVLKHFPCDYDMKKVSKKCANVFSND